MKFSRDELGMVFQYAAPTKEETLAGMRQIVPVIKDPQARTAVEGAIEKLGQIPEPECSRFVAATKEQFLAERDKSILRELAAARKRETDIKGHDLSGEERFLPQTRHMITLDVKRDCAVGIRGERFRFYLSDEGYRNAKRSEQKGEVAITSHAAVSAGKLYPDRKARQPQR